MAAKENGQKEIGSVEVYFAKKLANNDKKIRDRALKRMKVWLSSRNGDAFSELEMMKLWKGLFYCMWFSDKPLVQEDLAKSLANLIHGLRDCGAVRRFIDGFFQTMGREWHGIDALRLDKFYMLNRKFLREVFQYLKNENWAAESVDCVAEAFCNGPCGVSNEKYSNGVRMFIIETALEELGKICEDDVPDRDVVTRVVGPFLALGAQTEDILVFKAVEENILKKLLPGSEEKVDGLSVNCLKMANRIFEEAGKQSVSTKRRKCYFKYSNLFRKALELEEKAVKESLDGGQDENKEPVEKKKGKKRKTKSKDKTAKTAKKTAENVENQKVDISNLASAESNVSSEDSNSHTLDPIAHKLDFETSYALEDVMKIEKDSEVAEKKPKKKSKKLRKSSEKLDLGDLKDDSGLRKSNEGKRKRKSKEKNEEEAVSKQAKEEVENSTCCEPSDKEKITENGIEKIAVNTTPILPSTEVEKKPSPSLKKPSRRQSLARKAKKKRLSNGDEESSKPTQNESAATSSTPKAESSTQLSPKESSSLRKSIAKKSKPELKMSAAKKRVVFELSKNAITSISNLKISPATVFTPEQRPKRGVLKERRRASDFF